MEAIRVSAKTVDDAITKALIELGTTSDKIEYEIIEKGSSGFLGLIGGKSAVISAWIKDVHKETEEEFSVIPESVKKEENTIEVRKETKVKHEDIEQTTIPAAKTPEEFLQQVCDAIELSVKVESSYNEEEKVIDINLAGEDMGILIGKRGQTLDSLQYLAGLVANKGQDEYIRVKLDTEDYRERRKDTLENLAKNLAFKVRRTKRPVSLEPMNPYERRVIHAALQNDKFVVTRSEGEEPFRHVVISLKRERNYNSRPNSGKRNYGNGNRYRSNNKNYNHRNSSYSRGKKFERSAAEKEQTVPSIEN
jgi:spoIIIJ-associated protein